MWRKPCSTGGHCSARSLPSHNHPVTHRTPSAPAVYSASWIGWLSLAQLISWGTVFYTFALIMAPVERELGLSRAQSSVAFSLALLVEGLLAYPVGR